MPVYGNRLGQRFYATGLFYSIKDTMSTAIIRHFDDQYGFVIGADGLETKGSDYEAFNKNTRKIFGLNDHCSILAYSFRGAHRNTSDSTGEVIWNLSEDVQTAASAISGHGSQTLLEYAEKLAAQVNLVFEDAKTSGKIQEYPTDQGVCDSGGMAIVELFLDGYYYDIASRATVTFRHNNHVLAPPEVCGDPLQPFDIVGPMSIWHAFKDLNNPLFEQYRPIYMNARTVQDVAFIIDGYLRACASREGEKLFPMARRTIGGDTHVAVVTPSSFDWVPGFEPKEL
jgi:hypothetical protein